MKRSVLRLMAAIIATTVGCQAHGAGPLKVYILAGQSNMLGNGKIETIGYIGEDPATAPMLKDMFGADGKPVTCEDVYISYYRGGLKDGNNDQYGNEDTFGKLTGGYGARGGKIGPEFTFGIYMQKHVKEPILIIKTAWGGMSLCNQFRPPSAGPYELCELAKKKFAEHPNGAHAIPSEKDRPEWFRFALYSELLSIFIREVRKDLNAPAMPFVIGVMGQGGENIDKGRGDDAFREAMRAPARMPEYRGNVFAVETAPFWDEELSEIWKKLDRVKLTRRQLRLKDKNGPNADGKMTAEQQERYIDDFKKKIGLTPEDEAKANRGASDGGYHYLGSAKILARIGKAFADVLATNGTMIDGDGR